MSFPRKLQVGKGTPIVVHDEAEEKQWMRDCLALLQKHFDFGYYDSDGVEIPLVLGTGE